MEERVWKLISFAPTMDPVCKGQFSYRTALEAGTAIPILQVRRLEQKVRPPTQGSIEVSEC